MHNFSNYPYSLEEIKKSVHGIGMNRKVKFKYEILGPNREVIGQLNDASDAEISCDNDSSIKKSINLSYKKTGESFVSNRLMPVVSFLMPDGNYLDFPQGVYMLGGIDKKESGNSLIVDITLYDEIKRLENEKTDSRYFVAKGANYTVEIRKILNKFAPYFTMDFTTETLAVDREWDIGKSYLEILNDLLRDINYADIWTDEKGIFRARKKKTIDEKTEEYTYEDDETSIQFNGVVNSTNYFDIPNKWIITASNPDSLPLVSTLSNQADIDYRGQTLTKFMTIDYIANQTSLDEYVRLVADNDKVTEKVIFDTALAPFHDVNDVYRITNNTHGIDNKYQEKSWSMPLEIGVKMRHEAVRKVNIYDEFI